MQSQYDEAGWSEPSTLFHTYSSFLWGVGAPSLAIQDTTAYVCFKSYQGPYYHPAPGQPQPHVVTLEGLALVYGSFSLVPAPTFAWAIIDTILKGIQPLDTLVYRTAYVPRLISPSITVDPSGVRYVLWEGDSTQLRFYTLTDTITQQRFDAWVDFPWLCMNHDRIDLVWTSHDSIRFRYGWTGTSQLSQIQTIATCQSPFSSGPYLTWIQQTDMTSSLYWGALPGNAMIEPQELDCSSNALCYPALLYTPETSHEPAVVEVIWTEYSIVDSSSAIYYCSLPIDQPAPEYTFDMGTETPVPVCLERDGYLCYGTEDYHSVDYDSTELVYHLVLHSPQVKYKLRWTYYHEEATKQKLQFNVDDIVHHNRWVNPGEKIVEHTWLPSSVLQDNEITIRVKLLQGWIAVLSGLEIYMSTVGGGGGPQGTELALARPFCFERMYPNPARGILKVRFISPDERAVAVKMYDVVGRCAETVFDGTAQIGINEFLIQPDNLSAGIYFVRVEAEGYNRTEKIVLMR